MEKKNRNGKKWNGMEHGNGMKLELDWNWSWNWHWHWNGRNEIGIEIWRYGDMEIWKYGNNMEILKK
jgi:URI fold toxin 2